MSFAASQSSTVCPSCGAARVPGTAYCAACGAALTSTSGGFQQPGYPAPYAAGYAYPNSGKRVAAGVLGILLGGFGAHRFYLGDVLGGFLRLLITLVTCGAGSVIGLIEGIIYLTKSDAEFDATYVYGDRTWF